MKKTSGRIAVATLSLAAAGLLTAAVAQSTGGGNWTAGGGDIHNTRNASSESKINAANVGGLTKKWEYTTQGDVSATPTVSGDTVYAVDWGGYLHAIDAKTGTAKWSHPLSYYTGNSRSVSRTSPVVYGSLLLLGDQGDLNNANLFPTFQPGKSASVMAIDRNTGELVWRTFVDSHVFSIVTSSPVAFGNDVYVGVASLEEVGGFLGPGYPFTFRGSVVSLNATTGAINWKTHTCPAGYTGAAVWGSTPVVDVKRGSLYVATGNNYTVPPAIDAQIAADPANGSSYLAADDYVDAVVALDLGTGSVKWARRVQGPDTWTLTSAIYLDPATHLEGPDYDFGSGPNLYTTVQDGKSVDLLGAGQKSGIYWALNPDTGAVVWNTQVGPGGVSGGIQWGSAVDGNRVYCAVSNSFSLPWTLGANTYNAGLWAGLNAATGAVEWKVPDQGHAYGMVTSANGVVFSGSTTGMMFARNAATGATLWSFNSGSTVYCGPSVVNGTVYWGTGYSRFGQGSAGSKIFAFGLP